MTNPLAQDLGGVEAFCDAMDREHGYRAKLLPNGILLHGRDADRYEGWELAVHSAEIAGALRDAGTVIRVGNYGAAFDPPDSRRAFTYQHQPGNVDASRLGRAADEASKASAGDSIDRGLALLKALQEMGFGVYQISDSAMQQGGGGGE